MATPDSTRTTDAALAGDLRHAARYYLGNRTALMVLALVAIGAGVAFKWEWLVAAGIAPILLATLPCIVMCGLCFGMNRLLGGSCTSQTTQPRGSPERSESSVQANLAEEPQQMWVRSQSDEQSSEAGAASNVNLPAEERSKSDA